MLEQIAVWLVMMTIISVGWDLITYKERLKEWERTHGL